MKQSTLLCWLGLHEYTKWQTQGDVIVTLHDPDTYQKTPATERYEIQQRECVHCGIKKMRRERK